MKDYGDMKITAAGFADALLKFAKVSGLATPCTVDLSSWYSGKTVEDLAVGDKSSVVGFLNDLWVCKKVAKWTFTFSKAFSGTLHAGAKYDYCDVWTTKSKGAKGKVLLEHCVIK